MTNTDSDSTSLMATGEKNNEIDSAKDALDEAVLESIGGPLGLASPLVSRLLTIFRQEVVRLVHGIENALVNEDLEALSRHAHTLKSSCASMGALALSSLAREIEYLARQSSLAQAGAVAGTLTSEFARLMTALDALELKRLSASSGGP